MINVCLLWDNLFNNVMMYIGNLIKLMNEGFIFNENCIDLIIVWFMLVNLLVWLMYGLCYRVY